MTISGSLLGTALLSLYDNNGAPSEYIPGNSGPSASVVLKPGGKNLSWAYPMGPFACSAVIDGKAYFACRTFVQGKDGTAASTFHFFETDGTTVEALSVPMADIVANGVASGCTQNPLLFAPMTFYKGKLLLATAALQSGLVMPPNNQNAIAVFDPVTKTVERMRPFKQGFSMFTRWWIGGSSYDACGFKPTGNPTDHSPSWGPFTYDPGTNKLVFGSGRTDKATVAGGSVGNYLMYNRYGSGVVARSTFNKLNPSDPGRHLGASIDLDLTSFAVTGAPVTIAPGATIIGTSFDTGMYTGNSARSSRCVDWYTLAVRNNLSPAAGTIATITNDIDSDATILRYQGPWARFTPLDVGDTLVNETQAGFALANQSGDVYDFVLVSDNVGTSDENLATASYRAIRKATPAGQVTRYSMNPNVSSVSPYKKFPISVRPIEPAVHPLRPSYGNSSAVQLNSGGFLGFALVEINKVLVLGDDNVVHTIKVPQRVKAGENFFDPALGIRADSVQPYGLDNRNEVQAVQVLNGKIAVLHLNRAAIKGVDGSLPAYSSVHLDLFDDPRT